MSKSRVIIKRMRALQKVEQVTSHLAYVGRGSKTLAEHEKDAFFSSDKDLVDKREFVDRIKKHPALQHGLSIKAQKLVFSLREQDYEEYKKSGKDFKDLTRTTLGQYEKEKGVKLDWIANIHAENDAKKHPHCHVIIKGVSDIKGERGYTRIRFDLDDLKEMRQNFRQELEKEVPEDPERLNEILRDMSDSWEALALAIENDTKREQEEAELEREQMANKKKKGRER